MVERFKENPSARNSQVVKRKRDNIVQETGHDTYKGRGQLPEPTACPECDAVFHQGRWTWMEAQPAGAHRELCPACERVRDRYPAGFLTLSGPFFAKHRQEIVNLAQNEATVEMAEHPLHRIIDTEDTEEGVLITTTDIHLPRRIGEAVKASYKGELDFHYVDEDDILRVRWQR